MAGFMKNAMSYLGMSDDYQAVPRWPCEQNHHHPSEVI